tara:strand:- start:1269 stop:2672 length:1404 start_codon:yes stop_codon:yes gene_type:complete
MKWLLRSVWIWMGVLPLWAEPEFEAGSSLVDITPKEWPLHLRGSFSPKLAEEAHDPLTVRALVMRSEITVAIAIVDSCMVHRPELDQAKEIASAKTGIPASHMLVASTHTHSAPFANASNGTDQELAYQKLLIQGIADAIIQANSRLEPATAGYSVEELPDEVFNRRWFLKAGTMPENPFGETTDLAKMNPGRGPNLLHPAGPIDPDVSILSLRDAKGKPIGLLANYPLHYVGNTGGMVSADYFGEFARLIGVRLRQRPESKFVGMLSNGTSGDINNINFRNPRPSREPFEQIRVVANKVADSAYAADRRTDQAPRKLGMLEREVTLNLRVPTREEIERSKGYLERSKVDEKSVPRLAKIYAERVLAQAELGEETKILLQAVRIGDLAICAIPFEVLVEIGLELKSSSPFENTFVIELANGGFGYLPSRLQHAFGGYETWLATNKVEKDSAEIVVRNLIEMMDELHQ